MKGKTVNQPATVVSLPQATSAQTQPQPVLPTLAELTQRFWGELLRGGLSPNDVNDGDVGGNGSRWL